MTAKSEVYKCEVCGAIVTVVTGGKGSWPVAKRKWQSEAVSSFDVHGEEKII
ncbi:hypothetical protein [Desulfosarcina sp.]|uniref:hypothetical protein n=1 Tax=Desulfosarcina sp. TaxID=2027861 RepID=UPI00299F9E76|nr:hypothetical protein [Desulfosarcina sp.]MDX2452016.1 hypothetical protein [Desulfosarcina sp.]MDX2489800.1 hypothetical protein [Desulfosarcina sp.]